MLILGPRLKIVCVVLQVVPPGVGAIIAGSKNPHSRYLGRGVAQLTLVVFGSWPLIVPGVAGAVWAWVDAYRIGRDARPPGPMSQPTPDADPETLPPRKREKARRRNRGA